MFRRMATLVAARRRPNLPLVILGAVLAVLGFVSVLLIGQGSIRSGVTPAIGTTAVVVAAHDISGRTVLSKSDLTVAQMTSIPGSVAKVEEVAGMVVQVDVKQGQPLLSTMLARSDTASSSPTAYLPLPKGFVAYTLPTAEQVGVAGYVQTGDYIDILAVVGRPGGGYVVRTIYSSIHVIRVGAAPPEQSGSSAAAAIQRGGLSSSLTVAVSECQAEYLSWFVANAQLRYSLLSYQDYQPAPAAADTSCPATGSPKGVTDADIKSRWPGLL